MEDNIIKNIVSFVVSGEFQFNVKLDEITNFEKKEEVNNEKREFESACTDTVTNEFVKSQSHIAQFIQLIYDTFNEALNSYIEYKGLPQGSVFFLYKGGNILRIIAKDFAHELPGEAGDVLLKYYGDYFKKSDADFSIYINPSLQQFDKIFEEITNLSYLLLNYIRILFLKDMSRYFDYYSNNINAKANILLQLLNKINQAEALRDGTSKRFNGGKFVGIVLDDLFVVNDKEKHSLEKSASKRIDYLVDYHNADKTQLGLYKLLPFFKTTINNPVVQEFAENQKKLFNKDASELYISVNKTLRFKQQGFISAFNLVRMKVNFVGLFEENNKSYQAIDLGGELIDVSINHRDSSGIDEFFKHKKDYVRIFRYIDKDKEISFRGTSFDYLVHDLETILFNYSEFPWDDRKYGKRIKRLMFLYLLNLLSISLLTDIRPFIIRLKTEVIDASLTLDENNYSKQVNDLTNTVQLFINETEKRNYDISSLLKKYSQLLTTSNKHLPEFKEFINLLAEDFDIMLKTLYEIEQFINTKGKIDEEKLYEFGQFGGLKY